MHISPFTSIIMIGYHIERENTFNMAQFSASVNDMFPAHAFNG